MEDPITRAEYEEYQKRMEQEDHRQKGKRLVSLESKDGEMWRKVVGYVITAVIGIVLGFAFTQIGM